MANKDVITIDPLEMTDLEALEEFCAQLEHFRGRQCEDEALTRSLPKLVVRWLLGVTPRLKEAEVDYAELRLRVMSTIEELDDGTPYLTLRVTEECGTDEIAGPVPGVRRG